MRTNVNAKSCTSTSTITKNNNINDKDNDDSTNKRCKVIVNDNEHSDYNQYQHLTPFATPWLLHRYFFELLSLSFAPFLAEDSGFITEYFENSAFFARQFEQLSDP